MKYLINGKLISGILLLVIVLGAVTFWYLSVKGDQGVGKNDSETQEITTPNINVPEGWKAYKDSDTKWERGDLNVAFAYPNRWVLNEEEVDGSLNALVVEGDGYSIRIDQAGRGMNRPYDYVRSIGGFDARTWEEKTASGTKFTFGITSIEFVVYATVENDNQETLEKILLSMIFY